MDTHKVSNNQVHSGYYTHTNYDVQLCSVYNSKYIPFPISLFVSTSGWERIKEITRIN